LIADEATTALDVSVQASILELLDQVAAERAMALIVVSHDMSVVAGLCDQTAVMYAGRIVETGSTTQLFSAPRHPYTAALVECRPSIAADARYTFLTSIPGQLGPTDNVGNQCAFAPRCRFAIDRCTSERPPVGPVGADEGHLAACWRSQEALDFLHQVRRDTGLLPSAEVATTPLLEARDLEVHYPVRLPGTLRPVPVKAVDGVSLAVKAGTTLGVVGESGCGKSTVGRAVLGLQRLTRGSVHFAGQDLSRLDRATMRVMRRRMQLVVQSSFNSFDPRVPLGQAIAEAVRLTPEGRQGTAARVHELLDLVELPTRIASALPADVSGGQRQRASIARALSTRPDLIVADEPTSALDVSVRAGILNLLRGLQRDHQVSYIFISHDLAAVRSMSDEVAVMYFGHIVERGPADEVFERPAHPYTRALLDAVPGLGADETQQPAPIPGEVPSLLEPPPGCPFHPRCPRATDECRLARPALLPVRPGHEAACIHPIEGAREAGL
jgi:oligopeptide/dipeptide ABC transporter ATP-binding protein